LRAFDPLAVDGALAVVFAAAGITTALMQDIHDAGVVRDGYREPNALFFVSAIAVCAPIAIRRRAPLVAVLIATPAILVHFLIGWPEGTLPLAGLLLTFTVGARCPLGRAIIGLAAVAATILVLGLGDASRLDAIGMFGVLAQYAAVWAIGVAVRYSRAANDARLREAEERAEAERQGAARFVAEERLRIAQELHDVLAHSMSVIAVQAGMGGHVLDEHPDQARAALDAISTTARSTLAEIRRLLGVLRDDDGGRSHDPLPGLADLPRLVEEVRAAGVPATLYVEGATDRVEPGVGLSAYRVVQEALTNVIKHAGAPTRVDVTVRHQPGSLAVEVVDDGRGPESRSGNGGRVEPGAGQGHVGMRERVELWGGELSVGAVPGGGYRVAARLPCGEPV
jgi:signal transduction histidine kinase